MSATRRSVAAPLGHLAERRVLVPKPTPKRFYSHGIPGIDLEKLTGKLIVIEGADGSGRSTQIARLVQWLEGCGHATVQVGLKRSTLVSEELEQAKQGNILSHITMSLFYATDFADQLENIILPALTLSAIYIAYIARLTRSGMLEVLRSDYIRTARAKGLSERAVITRHAMRGENGVRAGHAQESRIVLLGRDAGVDSFEEDQ